MIDDVMAWAVKLVSKQFFRHRKTNADADMAELPPPLAEYRSELLSPRRLRVAYAPSTVTSGEIFAAVGKAGLGIVDVSTRDADLEDVFLRLTRPDDASAEAAAR